MPYPVNLAVQRPQLSMGNTQIAPRSQITHITVRGARQHNLRNVSVSIPRNTLTVVTGLSGSGKSSLAFDTIYAEGQRRYVETLSAYARQFLDQMERPDVDAIDGLSPAISIEQKTTSRSPRSTVGTITEIYDYLRLLYASVGQPHCPNCHRPISRQTADQIVERIVALAPGERITVLAPVVRGRKGEFREELEALDQQGFRARIDGEMTELTEGMRLEKRKNHTVEAIVDRIILKTAADGKPDTRRLETSVLKALQMANGLVLIGIQGRKRRSTRPRWPAPTAASTSPASNPAASPSTPPTEPAPSATAWAASTTSIPPRPSPTGLNPCSMAPWAPAPAPPTSCVSSNSSPKKPRSTSRSPSKTSPPTSSTSSSTAHRKGEAGRTGFHGIFAYLRSNLDETKSEGYREYMMQYMSATTCPRCHGKRLRPESLAVTVNTQSIADFTALSLERALTSARALNFTGRDRIIADRLQREIIERLEFLNAVGLGYLSLDRSAATLSGGEGQRIRLATQIGSRLRGVLYVLDEPSIGLHQRDNQRLIAALENLRDLGNTVLVVEHDEDTMRKADYMLDLGPGAGKNGGFLMAAGTPQQIMDDPTSVTGQYLSGKLQLMARSEPRPLTGNWITVENAHSHNLQNVTAHFPLGIMTVVTGVSGSGKSTLVNDILYRALAKNLYGSREEPGQHGKLRGVDQLDKVIQIDQSPIGRTPRSNPATYTGVFTAIRDIFAMLPESRERGYKPGRFSFNVKGGRCEACQGEGQKRIEMNFLPDVYVLCDVCNGRRYNQETLAVKFNGYSIADLLDLAIEDALPVLKDIPAVNQRLQTLVDVGLGYIHLGQSATTLSGGEAQRMKLARELSKRQTGRTLYLLDEPTTGLHFDDVRKLLEVLHRLTDLGNTVIIIEHNLDIIRNADYVIDMGPEGGEAGGRVIAHGTPEQIATVPGSYTGQFLARYYTSADLTRTIQNNGASHAGPQPFNVAIPEDRKKDARGKFIVPPKKTGLPTANSTKTEEGRPAKKSEKKAAAKRVTKKVAK